ncbi:MAG: hypothetical protein OHM77_08835 [Candidatus Nitricoxidivorans perseverans]|uniref:Uncharacterized protein n=1 Tax=Candidatus Nitricoxidivorans perseverans TaxID=2975601 RepID=A0AA49FJV8_9PROT|nr:MAG: hypothetical protein OHM77_08835 [Candidatus Nitricoxidivorans perseverans]
MMMEEAAKHAAGQMSGTMMGNMMSNPMAHGAVMAATGFAAGRGILGAALFRNPLLLLAAGVAAGYLLHRYEKEIVLAVTKATGMGKDFVLHQKENLNDLVAEAQATEARQATPPQA